MIARLLVSLSMAPITLVYRMWGRGWLDDEQCRILVTAITRATFWLARRRAPASRDVEG